MKSSVKYAIISLTSLGALALIVYLVVVYTCYDNFLKTKVKYHVPNILDSDINFVYMQHHQKKLLQLLIRVKEFLGMYNIPWWLFGGSLLGAKRHQGFIPWDDDIDLGILKHYDTKLLELHKKGVFAKHDLDLQPQNNINNINNTFYQIRALNENDDIVIDVFTLEEVGNLYQPTAHRIKNEYISKQDLFPLRQELFHNVIVNVPQNCIPYLDRVYPAWDKRLHIRYPHKVGEICSFLNLSHLKKKIYVTDQLQQKFLQLTQELQV